MEIEWKNKMEEIKREIKMGSEKLKEKKKRKKIFPGYFSNNI